MQLVAVFTQKFLHLPDEAFESHCQVAMVFWHANYVAHSQWLFNCSGSYTDTERLEPRILVTHSQADTKQLSNTQGSAF